MPFPLTRRLFRTTWTVLVLLPVLAGCGGGGDAADSATETTLAVSAEAASCPALQDGVALRPGSTLAPECTVSEPTTLAYASGDSHQLDLYRPASASGYVPTVIWIHGGGWMMGSRIPTEQVLRLVCRGYAVASIDYRLSDTAKFPAQIHDVKAAIRFLRANAAQYKLDPNRFASFGSSAGGHLATLAATSIGVTALEDLSQGNRTTSSAVQAAVDWYGPMDFARMDTQVLAQPGCTADDANHSRASSAESLFLGCTVGDAACAAAVKSANPVTYVSASTPPLFVLHGTADCTVPVAQSDLLKTAMARAGRCAVRRNLIGADHGGDAWETAPPQDALAGFLDAVLKP